MTKLRRVPAEFRARVAACSKDATYWTCRATPQVGLDLSSGDRPPGGAAGMVARERWAEWEACATPGFPRVSPRCLVGAPFVLGACRGEGASQGQGLAAAGAGQGGRAGGGAVGGWWSSIRWARRSRLRVASPPATRALIGGPLVEDGAGAQVPAVRLRVLEEGTAMRWGSSAVVIGAVMLDRWAAPQ